MLRFFVSIVLFAASLHSVVAQISLKDLLKGKVTVDTTGVSSSKPAEPSKPSDSPSPVSLPSSDGVMLRVIEHEASIVRQQYRLERNGDYFGKNNMAYFGETYTLAVKVAGGTFLAGEVVEPWKYDKEYDRMNPSRKYDPVLFRSYQRKLSDSTYQVVDLELNTQYTAPANVDKSLYLHVDAHSDFGLILDNAFGRKEGYMIWAYANTNVQDSAMKVSLRQLPLTLETREDSVFLTMSPENPEKVIGGLYVVPRIESGGRVQYLLVGMAVKADSSKWALQILSQKKSFTKSQAVDNGSGKAAGEPGPEKKKGRTKKQSDAKGEPTLVK